MIPSATWFPSSLAERAAWMQNFAVQFVPYATALGFVAADVAQVEDDNADFQSIATTMVAVEAFYKAVIEFRVTLTEGDVGDPAPFFPSGNFSNPPNGVGAGIFERLNDMRDRILAAPNYTDEIGVALGIVSEGGGQTISSGDVMPEIELFAAATGYMFSIVVSKRYDSDQWQVWATPAGLQAWSILAVATGKSTDVTYEPGGEVPAPQQLQVRVQLRRNNQDYGNPSLIGQVTVNP